MKKRFLYLVALATTAFFASCEKNAVQEIDSPPTGAMIKFYNFSIGAPVVNFYANVTKVTAAVSATGAESATAGVAYSAVGPSLNYASIAGGSYTFKGVTPSTAAANPNTTISTLASTVQDGKYYSFYQSGIYNATTRTSDAFILEDKIPALDTAVAYVRFVNAIGNSNPMNFVAQNTISMTETVIGTAVAYKTGSEFVKVPQGIYNLYGRYPATPATNTISRTAITFSKGRVYTISSRGDMTVAASPFFDNTPNR